MTLANSLKRILDKTRSIPGKLGLRPYTVLVRLRTFPIGFDGYHQDQDTWLQVGGQAPKVRQLTESDVINSGGLYKVQDFEIKVTPDFINPDSSPGGTSTEVFQPSVTSTKSAVYFQLTGPGVPQGQGWYTQVGSALDSSLSYLITVRHKGYTL